MVQTFAQAWGIKPKVRPEPEPPRADKPVLANSEPMLQPKVLEKPSESKAEAFEMKAKEKPVEKERIVERIVEKQREGEYISVQYHKQLIFMLFIMHITSLIALLLVIFLKK
jgi:hypothetical protein